MENLNNGRYTDCVCVCVCVCAGERGGVGNINNKEGKRADIVYITV